MQSRKTTSKITPKRGEKSAIRSFHVQFVCCTLDKINDAIKMPTKKVKLYGVVNFIKSLSSTGSGCNFLRR